MAKAEVKCLYCGQVFDRNAEEFVKPNARRYAHKSCYENRDADTKAREELHQKCKELFGESYNRVKINNQLKKFVEENDFEVEKITKALEYFFEVQENDTSKANGGIGIVPHIYNESVKYWESKEETQKKMSAAKLEPQKKVFKKIKRQKITKPVNLEFFDLR